MITSHVYSGEVSIQPLSVLQSRRCVVRRWRPKDHGTGSGCKNWPNNVLLGRNLDEEQFQVDTHAVLSFILAAIAVRHDEQRVSFSCRSRPGDAGWRDDEGGH